MCAGGAGASLASRDLPRTTLGSRIRRDAAIYQPAPPPTGRRGRPRKKGPRLPTPADTAEALPNSAFTPASIDWRGRTKQVLVWSRPVLWYPVSKDPLMLLSLGRDPTGTCPDDFFFTTDLDAPPPPPARRPRPRSLNGQDPNPRRRT